MELKLIASAKGGDAGAFSRLVKMYDRRVYHTAYSYMRNMEEAKDVTQEVFATKIVGDLSSDSILGDDPVMAMVRLVFRNLGDGDIQVDQVISSDWLDPYSAERLDTIIFV